ncbi:MAG: glycosyltransferase family 2 protein [Phycisphaeraceae bacterium]
MTRTDADSRSHPDASARCTGDADHAAAPAAVAVIVVSYNTRELTLACLRSLHEQTRVTEVEVLVVDNASTDGSAEAIGAQFPQVRLFALEDNLGFAGANNYAAQRTAAPYLLLLNPDTVVLDGAVDRLVAFAAAQPGAGIWGGRTLFADGSLNPTSCWRRPTPWSAFCQGVGLAAVFRGWRMFDREAMGEWARDSVREVDIVTGCFFLIRRELWDRLGGFDPAFFMYGEEADLCLRARRLGATPMMTPDATITHYGGASERVRADKMVRLFVAKSQLFARHWGAGVAWFGRRTLDLWALTRLTALTVLGLVQPHRREQAATWRAVWARRRAWREVKAPGKPAGETATA